MIGLLDTAVASAREALECREGERLGPDGLGVILKKLVVAEVARRLGTVTTLRERLAGGDEQLRGEALAGIARALDACDAGLLGRVAAHPGVALQDGFVPALFDARHEAVRRTFVTRVGQCAFEELLGARVTPELRLDALDRLTAGERSRALPGRLTHAVVVGELIGAAGEIFPLILDAYAHDLRQHGSVFLNVIGVHASWLDASGYARRILFYEHASATLRETDLLEPLPFESCQFLYLGRENEGARHTELAARFEDRVQVNPVSGARRCDDKHATFLLLQQAGVPTPATALLGRGDAPGTLGPRLTEAGLGGKREVVIQPCHGTEGAGLTAVTVTRAARSLEALETVVAKLQVSQADDVVVRERIEGLRYRVERESYAADLRINVCWDGAEWRAESAYLQVAGRPEDVASSVGRGGRVVALSEGALAGLGLAPEEVAAAGDVAVAAARAVGAGLDVRERLTLVGVDLRLARCRGKLEAWVLDVNPRPAGLSHCELLATREPGVCPALFGWLTGRAVVRGILDIVRRDRDDDHRPLIAAAAAGGALPGLLDELRAFLRLDEVSSGDARINLLQERAILVLGDALWEAKRRKALPPVPELEATLVDVSPSDRTREGMRRALDDTALGASEEEYQAFINQFLTAVNEREMRDFARAKEILVAGVPARRSEDLRLEDPGAVYTAEVPMRVGISSANASDNWTFSKLRGGVVVNFALDLAPSRDEPPRPPIAVTLEAAERPGLELETISRLETDRATHVVIGSANAGELLAIPEGSAPSSSTCFRDIRDPLLLLKYSLAFSGIVGWRAAPEAYVREPDRALEDVRRFTGGRGLRLRLTSTGPSRSGFASSSCVALGLLSVLYRASGQDELLEPELLSSLALLLENEVGLKSGKQDTDGPLYPGVKAIRYRPTEGFLRSEITPLSLDEDALREHIVLVNSGIQRPPATGLRRGLNMRHLSYLSRDPLRFPAVMRSLEVHEQIVAALGGSDWPRLGALFTEYLGLRETIDPGATASVHDEAAGQKVLRLPFAQMIEQGLIHGGMYTGAMGGGCMMLVVTPRGQETVASEGAPRRRIVAALDELRAFRAGDVCPFRGLEVYHYAVNARGLRHSVVAPTSR